MLLHCFQLNTITTNTLATCAALPNDMTTINTANLLLNFNALRTCHNNLVTAINAYGNPSC